MKQKRIYRTPEVTIECFLVQEYMMFAPLSQAKETQAAPMHREKAF